MDYYDPEIGPNATEWLELDESERILTVEQHHCDARIDIPRKARKLHATIHTIVENQLALNDKPVVKALERLMKEGLSRHDAVHAIGSRVVEHIYNILHRKEKMVPSNARYYAAIAELTAASWRNSDR